MIASRFCASAVIAVVLLMPLLGEGSELDLLHYPIYVTLYKGYGYECNTGYKDYGDYGTPLFKKQLGFITKWQRG